MNSEQCLICGEIIPEGRQVCPSCEQKTRQTKVFSETRNEKKVAKLKKSIIQNYLKKYFEIML